MLVLLERILRIRQSQIYLRSTKSRHEVFACACSVDGSATDVTM